MQQTSETSQARPADADHARRSAAQEGALARLTAASLTAAGFQVTGPDDECRLVIASRAAQCELTVSDSADAELLWTPFAAEAADPHRVADLAAALLSGQAGVRHPDTVSSSDITFKGIVGMDLRAAGFKVQLNAYTDDYYYDVTADITVTGPPRRQQRSRVRHRRRGADVAPRLLGRPRRYRVGTGIPYLAARPVRRRPCHRGRRVTRPERRSCSARRMLTRARGGTIR